MSDTFGKANRATPAATLEQQILDPNHPKNDREWWAADEITRLTAEVEKLRALAAKADEAIARQQQDLEEATDRAADCDTLRAEVEKLRAALKSCIAMLEQLGYTPISKVARAALEEKR